MARAGIPRDSTSAIACRTRSLALVDYLCFTPATIFQKPISRQPEHNDPDDHSAGFACRGAGVFGAHGDRGAAVSYRAAAGAAIVGTGKHPETAARAGCGSGIES